MNKLIVFSAVLASTFFANADWLLWQITSADLTDFSKASEVKQATVYAFLTGDDPTEDPDPLVSYSLGGNELGNVVSLASTWKQQAKIDVSSYSTGDWSFYVELLNSSGEAIGRTKTAAMPTYAQLSDYIVSSDISTVPQANVWHGGGSFEAVPEPSSMALLALGAGLVGLRRKLKKGKKAQKEKRA